MSKQDPTNNAKVDQKGETKKEVKSREDEYKDLDKPAGSPTFTPKMPKDWTPPKIKKIVSTPNMSLQPGIPAYVRIKSSIRQEKIEGFKGKDLANVVDIIDLPSKQQLQLICHTVLAKELVKAYPDETYVGKSFMITSYKPPRKDYFTFTIAELEDS